MVLALVVLEIVRCCGLISETIVYERNTALPVTCKPVARTWTVDIILSAGKVPHEISPVHPVHLEVKEEGHILEECRLLVLCTRHSLATIFAHVCLVEIDILRVRAVPHTREKHLARRLVLDFARALSLDVLIPHRSPISCVLNLVWSIEILSIYKWIAAILLSAKVTHKCERIVRLVLIGRSLCYRADHNDAEERESYHDHSEAKQYCVCKNLLLLHCAEKAPEARSKQDSHEEYSSAVEWKSKRIHKETIEMSRYLRQIWNDSEQDNSKNHNRNCEDLDIFLSAVVSVLSLLVVEHEHQSRDCKKVQKVDSDRKAHQEADKHDPTVCIWSVCLIIPLGHAPEYKSSNK